MSKEPRAERAISILINENYFSNIAEDKEKLFELLYFFQEEQAIALLNKIKELEADDISLVFNNLMRLYPLSDRIIVNMIDDDLSNVQNAINSYDRSKSIIKSISYFIQKIRMDNGNAPRVIEDYKKQISELEKEQNKSKEQIEELKQIERKRNKLLQEVEQLKAEYEQLKASYTKEALEQQQIELTNKLNKMKALKAKYEEDANLLKSIENDLKKVRNGNQNFKKSLNQLSEVVKNLPDSEENY